METPETDTEIEGQLFDESLENATYIYQNYLRVLIYIYILSVCFISIPYHLNIYAYRGKSKNKYVRKFIRPR